MQQSAVAVVTRNLNVYSVLPPQEESGAKQTNVCMYSEVGRYLYYYTMYMHFDAYPVLTFLLYDRGRYAHLIPKGEIVVCGAIRV